MTTWHGFVFKRSLDIWEVAEDGTLGVSSTVFNIYTSENAVGCCIQDVIECDGVCVCV